MPRQEYLEELKIREKELLETLKAVRTLLSAESVPVSDNGKSDNGASLTPNLSGTSKRDMTWVNYTLHMLKEIGGRAKTEEVVTAAQKANPTIKKDRIKSAIRHHLSKLYLSGDIGAIKGKNKKEGYTYKVIK